MPINPCEKRGYEHILFVLYKCFTITVPFRSVVRKMLLSTQTNTHMWPEKLTQYCAQPLNDGVAHETGGTGQVSNLWHVKGLGTRIWLFAVYTRGTTWT